MKVLIIDDEPDICYLLSSILRQKQLQADFVNSLTEARMALGVHNPQLIFLDNHLPDGRGIDFIGDIKQQNSSTKVIMITAHDTMDDRNSALEQGVDGFIGKPFTREAIFNAIDKVLA